tara:strand:+ start:743 stop:1129 length:387 start_codon:yes stop_codon:yes gene_type:complete
MKDLIWLNLFSNEIEVIDETVFAGLKQYFVPSMFAKSIRLSYNKIKKFPEVLCKMEYLQELHLAGNELTGTSKCVLDREMYIPLLLVVQSFSSIELISPIQSFYHSPFAISILTTKLFIIPIRNSIGD